MSLIDAVVVSAGLVLAVLLVLLWMWVAGPSRVDVSNMLIKAVGNNGESLIFTNLERQSSALLQAPDIHSKLIL